MSVLTNPPLMRATHLGTARRFLLTGFLLQYVALVLLEFGNLTWDAFVFHNQTTTAENLLSSSAGGVIDTLLFSETWLLVASLIAWTISRVFGRVPFWSVIIAAAICSACYAGQRWLVWPPDDPENLGFWQLMVLKEAATVPVVLVGCWWWDKRVMARSAAN